MGKARRAFQLLWVASLLSFPFIVHASQRFDNFPRYISVSVYEKLTWSQKYAYLSDIRNQLEALIAEINSVRYAFVDIDAIEEYTKTHTFSLPDIPKVKTTYINAWHMHVLLRFLSQLPMNVYPDTQDTAFREYWSARLEKGLGYLATIALQHSLPEILKTHYPHVTDTQRDMLVEHLTTHIKDQLKLPEDRTFRSLNEVLWTFASTQKQVLQELGIADIEQFQSHLFFSFNRYVFKLAHAAWLSYGVSHPEAMHISEEQLLEDTLWKTWNTIEGISPFSDSTPKEEIFDYIFSPIQLRIAMTLVGEYHDSLKLRGNADIMTYREIAADISFFRYPQLKSKYGFIMEAWDKVENAYDIHIMQRIDGNRARRRIEADHSAQLLVRSPLVTESRHKLMWGTIQGKQRLFQNPTEHRMISLLHATKKLFESNLAWVIHQYQKQENLDSLRTSEFQLIQKISDDMGLVYTAYSWDEIGEKEFF